MTNLNINSTSTPYWCVVVPVEAYEISTFGEIKDNWLYYRIDNKPQCLKLSKDNEFELLGCITSSGMDEGVREIDTMLAEHWAGICSHWKVNIMKLLTHNQITLTADQKAVVVKQK